MVKTDGSCVYDLIPSFIGELGVVISPGVKDRVRMIFLPREAVSMGDRIREAFPEASPCVGKRGRTATQIASLLAGDSVNISLSGLDWEGLGKFERRVLTTVHRIPRGRVMTYGGVAAVVGSAGGARAVGNVMAQNRFPLAIPCHRVIRSDRRLGGFGGGPAMKRALLEREGVSFDKKGRVLPVHILSPALPTSGRQDG